MPKDNQIGRVILTFAAPCNRSMGNMSRHRNGIVVAIAIALIGPVVATLSSGDDSNGGTQSEVDRFFDIRDTTSDQVSSIEMM